MSAEPIVIYSHKIDPAGVLQTLWRLSPDLQVEGPADNWKRITITHRTSAGQALTVSFGHDPEYYAGTDWPNQMRGMQAYFSRFPQNENTQRIMLLIQSFQFSITTFPPPEPELYLDSDDPRLEYAFAVVKHLDGVIFTPSSLRDADGRVLYGAGVDPDPQAVMPAIYKKVPVTPRAERPRSQHGTAADPDEAPPPTAERVARRAGALAAVAARALLEQEDRADPGVEQTRQRLLKWVNDIGIGPELEPDEWKILQLPLGSPPRQDALNATWRLEGLGVLAWALGRFELPSYDRLVDPGKLLSSVGILNAERAGALLAEPFLRPAVELRNLRERLFAIHWRLTDWRLRHTAMNFTEVAKTAWFGPLDLTRIATIEGDLAIGDKPLSRAPPDRVAAAISSAMERHLAINWLEGGSDVYSKTDVST